MFVLLIRANREIARLFLRLENVTMERGEERGTVGCRHVGELDNPGASGNDRAWTTSVPRLR